MKTIMIYIFHFLGVGGYEGDGDVTQPDNLQAFREYVMEQTNGKGVHFVMADGVIIYVCQKSEL